MKMIVHVKCVRAELETRMMRAENVAGRGYNLQIHFALINFTLLFLKVVYAHTFFLIGS